jgi:hypothetical protein
MKTSNNNTREDALKWWNELTGSQREDYLVRYGCLNNDFSMNTTVINIYKSEHPELNKEEGKEDIPVQENIIGKPLDDYIKAHHTQEECIGFIDGYNTLAKENAQLKERVKTLEDMLDKIANIDNVAFGLRSFDVLRLKAEIKEALNK